MKIRFNYFRLDTSVFVTHVWTVLVMRKHLTLHCHFCCDSLPNNVYLRDIMWPCYSSGDNRRLLTA